MQDIIKEGFAFSIDPNNSQVSKLYCFKLLSSSETNNELSYNKHNEVTVLSFTIIFSNLNVIEFTTYILLLLPIAILSFFTSINPFNDEQRISFNSFFIDKSS